MKYRPIIAFGMLVLLCAAAPKESLQVQFDHRPWKPVVSEAKEGKKLVSFVPDGETKDHWKELLTVRFRPAGTQTVHDYAQKTKRILEKTCPKNLKWSVVSEKADDMVVQWSLAGCPKIEDQFELIRILRSPGGMHVVHYTSKLPDPPEDTRKKWVTLLNQARVIPAAKAPKGKKAKIKGPAAAS